MESRKARVAALSLSALLAGISLSLGLVLLLKGETGLSTLQVEGVRISRAVLPPLDNYLRRQAFLRGAKAAEGDLESGVYRLKEHGSLFSDQDLMARRDAILAADFGIQIEIVGGCGVNDSDAHQFDQGYNDRMLQVLQQKFGASFLDEAYERAKLQTSHERSDIDS